jgi:hypothetical protein
VSSVTCHSKAVCSGATCVCGTNYFGNGFTCTRTSPSLGHPASHGNDGLTQHQVSLPRRVCSVGTVSAGATCNGNDEPFDASEVVLAGNDAVTTSCPSGHVGNMTRRCVWSGPTSSVGVWAVPINNCKRTLAAPCVAARQSRAQNRC